MRISFSSKKKSNTYFFMFLWIISVLNKVLQCLILFRYVKGKQKDIFIEHAYCDPGSILGIGAIVMNKTKSTKSYPQEGFILVRSWKSSKKLTYYEEFIFQASTNFNSFFSVKIWIILWGKILGAIVYGDFLHFLLKSVHLLIKKSLRRGDAGSSHIMNLPIL